MPSFAGERWGQGSPGGDERSEHALDAAERRRNRSGEPPSTRIRSSSVLVAHRQRERERRALASWFFTRSARPPSYIRQMLRSAAGRRATRTSGPLKRE